MRVPTIKKEIAAVELFVPQELSQERNVEQLVDIDVLRVMEDISVVQFVPYERIQERTVELHVDTVVPPVKEDTAGAVQRQFYLRRSIKNASRRREWMSRCLRSGRKSRQVCLRSAIKNASRRRVRMSWCLRARLVPRERVQRRTNEQIVEVPLPQNTEDVARHEARLMREAIEARRAFELLMNQEPFFEDYVILLSVCR